MLSLDFKSVREKFILDVRAELSPTGATAILGQNGSGKTSLLRALAGLDTAVGKISVNESKWLDSTTNLTIPTRRRNLGYVSQQPKLFPNMSVQRNLEFAFRLATKRNVHLSKDTFSAIVDRFDLKALLSRTPSTLSGGEMSRIALGRALLTDPDLILLDEPLATIDIDRKNDLLPYLEQVLADHPIPMLYVTHDLTEVVRLCANTMVLQNGKVACYGSTGEVLHSPQTVDTTEQLEHYSILKVQYVKFDEDFKLAYFTIGSQTIAIPMKVRPQLRESILIRLRDREVAIATHRPKDISIRNALKCEILDISTFADSPFVSILLACGAQRFRARITRASMQELELIVRSEVFALIKSATIEL